jgi:hypothetical protein
MIRTKLLYLVGSLTLLTLFISTWGIQAQETTDEVLPERLEILVYPPTAENSAQWAAVLETSVPQRGVTSAPAYHPPYTTLVYENFEAGNLEIYKNTPQQARINLTNHPASDMHPRLNHGSTHVIFASNRDGSYELYKMAVDGSQLVRLTFNGADDVKPAWSPDGTKIAFESYRDGQAEIYVMNADGSNQTRLTNHPDFDGMPAWSPDGQTITFSSRRTGGYRIYTMDAATGANLTQRSDRPYSLFPVWSPDGEYIAFSADMNEDGWLDTSVIRTSDDGIYSAIVSTFDSYKDLWVGSWHPTGEEYAFSVLTYRAGGGNVFLTQAELLSCPAYVGHLGNCPAFNHQDIASANPDIRPSNPNLPVVTMHPLPTYVSSEKLYTVSWTSKDAGIDLQTVDLQYRVGENGSWTDWGSYPPLVSSLPLTLTEATGGNTLYFRGRATDRYFAVGNWSTPVSIEFYGRDIRGQLLDNRGEPVRGANLAISPLPADGGTTDHNGRYYIRTQTNNAHQLTIAGMPTLELTADGRRALPHAYLAPANNLLTNTHFENGATGWASSAAPRYNSGYTGQAGFVLGQRLATCSNCTTPQIYEFPWWSNFQFTGPFELLLDQKGNAHLFFDSNGRLYYSQHNVLTGEWPVPQLLPSSAPFPYYGNVVTDNHGTIHVIGGNRYYQRQNGQWSASQEIWSLNDSAYATYTGVDDAGRLHVIADGFQPRGLYYLVRSPNGIWTTPQFLQNNFGDSFAFVTPSGQMHLFLGLLAHIVVLPDGTKTEHIVDLGIRGQHYGLSKMLYFEEDDSFLLTGGNGETNVLLRYTSKDGWSRSYSVPNTPEWYALNTKASSQAMAVLTYNDKARVLTMPTQTTELEWLDDYARGESGIDGSITYRNDTWGNLHTLIIDWDASKYVYYGPHAVTAVSDQTHTLAQVVTIPADMPNPTVSLMYRTVRDIPGDDTQFEVRLTNGISTTTHVLPPTAVVWEHAWFDASEWAGETVTLTLAAVQRAGDPLLRVDVDDVSLGSAAPDTWLAVDATRAAMPNEAVTVHLHYGNLSPDLLSPTATLTLTLPAGLTVNSISVTPTVQTAEHLIWQLGDLPADSSGTISLTVTVNGNVPLMSTITATAELRTPLAEPSWANNAQTWPLFIGRRAYLPAIFR